MPIPPGLIKMAGAAVALLVYSHQQEIKELGQRIYNWFDYHLRYRITIARDRNPRLCLAIRLVIEERCTSHWQSASDGSRDIVYRLDKGKYSIETPEYGKIKIEINKEEIMISTSIYNISKEDFIIEKPIDTLHNFLNNIYTKYTSSSNHSIFYTSDGDNWSVAHFRDPRNFNNISFSHPMALMLEDVDHFIANKREYQEKGHPYRRGYLLQGPPGTGKTTMIEAIASKHNMPVFLLNLNSKDMTDATLINLLTRVPQRSIIAIEEVDLQLETLRNNGNNQVSMGGLLSALDGPQRLSSSTIVVLTTNNANWLKGDNQKYEQALLRKGRIDQVFIFTPFKN